MTSLIMCSAYCKHINYVSHRNQNQIIKRSVINYHKTDIEMYKNTSSYILGFAFKFTEEY